MKKKVVFFVANLTARPHRRIQETISHGFAVDVYCLCKEESIVTPDYVVSYFEENEISHVSYFSRLIHFIPKILNCVKSYDRKKTIFYFFSLNTALASLLLRRTYVYEESDMLFDRFGISFLRRLVIYINKRIIRRSKLTVFTSQGFAQYYFRDNYPDNLIFIPNKVNRKCLDLPEWTKNPFDVNHIRFGFVGKLRYITLYNFAEVIATRFPQHEFYFYGKNGEFKKEDIETLKEKGNVFFHGVFKNPEDLPKVYSHLDFVVATYDTTGINPRYAEPNKVYESIFFRTPIIVSSNSFLETKVRNLKIGTAVNAFDKEEIESTVRAITESSYEGYMRSLMHIDRREAVGDMEELFNRMSAM